jgi:hypothetical protein
VPPAARTTGHPSEIVRRAALGIPLEAEVLLGTPGLRKKGVREVTTIHIDSTVDDRIRRKQLYEGDLLVFSATESSNALCRVARELSEQAFAPHEPVYAQDNITPETYVELLADLKPRFIHDARCKEFIAGMLGELGCDTDKTYFDVPRLRTMAHGKYLRAGLAYQFHAHRDTWFSAPMAQLNWWLPVYPIVSDNSMAFHLRYFDQPIRNSSGGYDYEEWKRGGRQQAANQVGEETRKQPEAEEPIEFDPQIRVVTPPGGILVFSAAHLHSTVPNTTAETRFSIDFRTVNLDDLSQQVGARNVDSACTGTTLCDFLRASDLAPMPDELIELLGGRAEPEPVAVG